MRSPFMNFIGANVLSVAAVVSTTFCFTATLSPSVYASSSLTGKASISFSPEQLMGATTNVPPLSTDVLLGEPAYTTQSPTMAKRWHPSPAVVRLVPRYWAISPSNGIPSHSLIATQTSDASSSLSVTVDASESESPPSPNLPIQNLSALDSELSRVLLEAIPANVTAESDTAATLETDAETNLETTTEVFGETAETLAEETEAGNEVETNIFLSQSLPSLEQIQQIQRELRDIQFSQASPRRRAYPGITISNPSGYGADSGQIYAGIGYQSRARFTGGPNPGTIFGGGVDDGTAGIGIGFGDARKSVGFQVSYTFASFGNSRAPFSGGFNAKLHKQFGNGWSAALGGEGIVNFGRLNGSNEIQFNDFENTYYSVVTKTIALRENFEQPFSRLTITGGAGSGRFRSPDQIGRGEFAIGAFGSAALQVHPSANLITEWTGQDLAVGLSIAPFRNFSLVFTPAIRDIAGEGDGDPRFVMGVGVSISDVFSSLGL